MGYKLFFGKVKETPIIKVDNITI